jgi:putative ABC transport system permease protein
MDIVEGVTVAVDAIRAHKLRSFLTMLGIIVGVSAVIAMISLGEGAKRQVEESITSLGTNLLYVKPGSSRRGAVRLGSGTAPTLSMDDAEAIHIECPSVVGVAPHAGRTTQVKYGNKNWASYTVGATPVYEVVHDLPIESGTFFDEGALRSRARLAVLGETVIENIFGDDYPIGKVISINRVAFTVIGTIAERGATHWYDPDDVMIVPLSTAQVRVFGTDLLSGINVKVRDRDNMDDAVVEVEDVLRRRHRLTDDRENDFYISNQADIISVYGETARAMTFLLAGIACVSLVVGGIGIMNIMLVSVTGIGLAFVFAAGVGVFFGIYPARKASMLDRIVALRYE